jgi:site-specific recombinase XerD
MLQGAYAQSTIDAYYRDFCVFVQWCERQKKNPLPCGADVVASFLDDQSKTKAAALSAAMPCPLAKYTAS